VPVRAVSMLRRAFPAALLLFLALPVSSALAGRLIVTGHDADLHCSGGSGCHYVTVAVNYVRAGAPDPTKPVLILDRDQSGGTSFEMEQALDLAFPPAGSVPRVVMDPRSMQFAMAPLTTNDYSAILIASDTTCGGCDLNNNATGDPNLTPDSDAINARASDIAAFFNQGGGLFVTAGAQHADGNPSDGPDNFYNFVPLPLGGVAVSPPFTLTAEGRALGFVDDPSNSSTSDINCCATHNSFHEPGAGSALKVAERDSTNAPETLFADGTISGGQINGGKPPPPVEGKSVNVQPVSGKVLVKLPSGSTAKIPGAHSAASGFIPLSQAASIPVGSILDTTQGVVKLTSAANKAGATQNGKFSQGQFKIGQTHKNSLTTLTMGGGSLSGCHIGLPPGGAARARVRRLVGNARGRFSTRGRNSSATVRGTQWSMTDTCRGTLTSVKRGTVVVRDFNLHKNKVIRAGHKYLARSFRLTKGRHSSGTVRG
jgi:hypothetical protein